MSYPQFMYPPRGMTPFGGDNDYSNRNIYLRGLSPETSDQNLLELCSLYGAITSAKAIIDKDTNKCKGYGFVMFDSGEVAEKARQGLIQSGFQASFAKLTYNERMMGIQGTPHPSDNGAAPHFPADKAEDPTNLYISNLPLTYNDQDLSALLGKFGRVVSTRILVDKYTGASRGIALARMSTHEECDQAVTKLNNTQLEGGSLLQVKFADNPLLKKPNKPWMSPHGAGMYPVMPSHHQYHQMDHHMARPANPSYMGMHGGQPVSPRMPSYPPPYGGGYGSYPIPPYPMMGVPPTYNHGQMQ